MADGLMGDILSAATTDPFNMTTPSSAAAPAQQSHVRRALRYLLARRMAWRDAPPCRHNGTPRPPAAHGRRWLVRSYVRTVGMVFEDTAPPYFPLQDLAVAALGAVCAGVADGVVSFIPCVATISLSTAAALAHCVSVVRRRPALTRAQHAFLVVSNALAFSSVFLALLQYCGGLGDSYQAIADVLQSCQSVISIIMTLLTVGLCIQFIGESFRRMLRRQRHIHQRHSGGGVVSVLRSDETAHRLLLDDALLDGDALLLLDDADPLADFFLVDMVADDAGDKGKAAAEGDDGAPLLDPLLDLSAFGVFDESEATTDAATGGGADDNSSRFASYALDDAADDQSGGDYLNDLLLLSDGETAESRRLYTRDATAEEMYRNLHNLLQGPTAVEGTNDHACDVVAAGQTLL
jgi:hypothetical protein